MPEEVKPAEPPPSSAPVNGDNDLEKLVNQAKLIHRGVLRDILKIVPKYSEIEDAKGKKHEVFSGYVTQILMDDETLKRDIKVKYRGIILPDSMDNIIEVYKTGDRIQIKDVDEGRLYA